MGRETVLMASGSGELGRRARVCYAGYEEMEWL
jgi:hypothetical protein